MSSQTQLVLALRYIDSNYVVQERSLEFLPVVDATSDSIARVPLDRLNGIFSKGDRQKLIVQAYDGASVTRGERADAQQKVRAHFKIVHYVHCYEHQLNLIMQQATSHIPVLSVFFSGLCCIATFLPGHQNSPA